MTMALCFNCGHTKFGAIVACPECQVSSTGNIQLDIAFSDHHISTSTIGAFGEVIRSISRVCDDDELRFWAFMRFVTLYHREILSVNMDPERAERCDAILAEARPPAVQFERSLRGEMLRRSAEDERSKGEGSKGE